MWDADVNLEGRKLYVVFHLYEEDALADMGMENVKEFSTLN